MRREQRVGRAREGVADESRRRAVDRRFHGVLIYSYVLTVGGLRFIQTTVYKPIIGVSIIAETHRRNGGRPVVTGRVCGVQALVLTGINYDISVNVGAGEISRYGRVS